jgi:hypothetical protein
VHDNQFMTPRAQVKGFVDRNWDSSVGAIKTRLFEGLDGRPMSWLADKTGDNPKNVQRWIKGEVDPPVDFVPRYCEATDLSIHWVMTGEGPRRSVPLTDVERWIGQMPPDLFRALPRPDGDDETSANAK